MTEPKRARRIRDKQRMKAKAKRVFPWDPQAHKLADHIKCCSCWMCGHRRKHEGPPIRDLRAMGDRS